jgi:hypothetical protein
MKKILLLAVLTAMVAVTANAQAPSLVAHYKFNGNLNDNSGNGYHATQVNTPVYVAGHTGYNGQAIDMASSGGASLNYAGNASAFQTQDFTYSVWCNVSSLPNQYTNLIENGLSTGNTVFFRIYKTNSTSCKFEGGFYESASNYHYIRTELISISSLSGWHLFTITSSLLGSTRTTKIFLDSDQLFTDETQFVFPSGGSPTPTIPYGNTTLNIGRRDGVTNFNFNGLMDDVRIYNYALTATGVVNIFNQYVNIPDANFKAYLVGNAAINTNSDNEISYPEAEAFTGTINCANLNIADLTGIEAFTNLTQLICRTNPLTTLNVTNNPNLTIIDCGNSQLTTLNLSNNTALTELFCYNSQLTTLDISANTSLKLLSCSNNQLTSLNVANGNNQNFTYLLSTGNPNLTCIQVDDATYSTTNWTGNNFQFDATASFSENCIGSTITEYTISVSTTNNGGTVSGDGTFEEGETVTLTATPNPDYVFVKWTENGTEVSTDNPYTFVANGDRTIVAEFESTAGINEVGNNELAGVYPNPATTELNIVAKENVNISIIDVLGKTIATQTLNAGTNTINVSNFTKGIYFVQTANSVVKFIKE